MDIIIQDLKNTDTTWKEAKELAEYKARWRWCSAQCIHRDTSWTKT